MQTCFLTWQSELCLLQFLWQLNNSFANLGNFAFECRQVIGFSITNLNNNLKVFIHIFSQIEELITWGPGGLNMDCLVLIWVMLIEKQYFHIRDIHCIQYVRTKPSTKIFASSQCFSDTAFIRVWSLDPDQQNIDEIIFSKPSTANINLTCTFPPPQRDLSHMAPMLTVPEVSFSRPASFSLLLRILQQALLSNRCSLPKNSLKILVPLISIVFRQEGLQLMKKL